MNPKNVLQKLVALCMVAAMMLSVTACTPAEPASTTGAAGGTTAPAGTTGAGGATQPSGSAAPQVSTGPPSNVKTADMIKTLDVSNIKSKKDSMTVVIQADPGSFDPAENVSNYRFQSLRQIYETLVIYDENGTLTPWLAESWEYEDDRTLVFKIRKGVKFHDGDELKASDVLFTFKRLVDDNTAGSMQVNRVNFDKSEVVDDYTVKLVTDEPYAILLNQLENPLCEIISEDTYKANNGNISGVANGTGPYKMVKYAAGDSMTLEGFADYWIKGQPFVKNVTLRYINDASARAMEIESGGADLVFDIAATDLDRLAADPNVALFLKDGAKTEYLTFNQAKKPFEDVRVREAIWLALDRESLVESSYGGVGVLSTSYVGQFIAGRHPDLGKYFPTQDVARAKELLKEAGYADGFTTNITVNNSDPQRMNFCEMLQAQLAEVGITLELNFIDAVTWNSLAVAGETHMNVYGFTASTGEAGRNLIRFLPTSNEHPVCSWNNEEFNNTINTALSTVDEKARYELYYKCQEMLMKNFILLPICQKQSVGAGQPDLRGFFLSPSYENHMLQFAYFE